MNLFDYDDREALGKVISVDTSSVIVEVLDIEKLKSLQVNRLVVLQSSKAEQFLIGLIEKLVRKKIFDDSLENEDNSLEENLSKITLIGTFKNREGLQNNVFRRTLETVPEIDANCFALEHDKLTNFMQVISQLSDGENSLSLGTYTLDDNAKAYINGNKLFQRHAFIGGSTGSGKSWTTAKIIEQMAKLNNVNSIIFDLHGEYKPLKDIGNIEYYKIAGPSDIEQNKGLIDNVLHIPYWLLTYEALVSMFVDRSDQNAPNQSMIISREIKNVKKEYLEEKGETDVLANFTIDSPVPFSLENLLEKLNAINSEMVPGARAGVEKAGDFNGKLSRMISRLENKISDRRMGFLFGGGDVVMEFDWLNKLVETLIGVNSENSKAGIKIVDFSEVPSDILPLIVSLIARLSFSVQQWTKSEERHPIALLCDEAHLYIPNKSSSSSSDEISLSIFERISKEGRKYGLSLVVISQRPSEVNRTVLSQCSNFIAMRLTNTDDQMVIKKLLPDNLGGFGDILPILDTGEALVVGDASLLPSRIRIDKPLKTPDSGTVEFWDEWQNNVKANRINNAVNNWRKQNIN
ncbi:ATP-binding protein [Aliarcobacter butzleri]|uniref:ATP-binding protein n=1 Tax=Aliarcobacter butzleri TaxID=28197 RepID=UPI003B2113F1